MNQYKQNAMMEEAIASAELANTPDTEWVREYFRLTKQWRDRKMNHSFVEQATVIFIRGLLTSRDTYWKERVEETRTKLLFVGEKVLKEMSEIYAVDIKYADKKQWLEPSEFERIFLHRFNEAGLKALDTLLDNLK